MSYFARIPFITVHNCYIIVNCICQIIHDIFKNIKNGFLMLRFYLIMINVISAISSTSAMLLTGFVYFPLHSVSDQQEYNAYICLTVTYSSTVNLLETDCSVCLGLIFPCLLTFLKNLYSNCFCLVLYQNN